MMNISGCTLLETDTIYQERDLFTYQDGKKSKVQHYIAQEMALTIVLNGEKLATLACSPHSFELLALGFLVSEGLLPNHDQLKNISYHPEQGAVWIDTASGAGRPARHLLHQIQQIPPVARGASFTVKELLGYMALLDERAETFRLTGGVHEVALAHRGGFVVSYEDVGRHNALDRVLGYSFLNKIDTSDKAVILSGRIASEMLTKAARIGVPVLVSRSAPTCLSIDLAEQLGITLVGFARGNSLNVYTHFDRIIT